MSFKLHDAGRSESKRPHQTRDCTVRALAMVLAIGYDAAYEILKGAGRKCSVGFNIEGWARKATLVDGVGDQVYFGLQAMGFYQASVWKAAHKGERYGIPKATKRYRLMDFLKDNPKGRFIVGTAKHVFAVVDGTVYDDMKWHYLDNRPVYSWLTIRPVRMKLWQAYAVKPVCGVAMKRALAVVEGATYKAAMRAACDEYEWATKGKEDVHVESLEGGSC
jgi:hypothetical protein